MGQTARRLSLGQRMRGDLAASLLHDPKILYLDEPTIGLDIEVKDRVRAFIRKIVEERGTTVMLTTHDLDDIEDICKRIVIIDGGRDDLRRRAPGGEGHLRARALDHVLPARPGARRRAAREAAALRGRAGRDAATRSSCASTASTPRPARSSPPCWRSAELNDFHIDEPAIEDVIRKVYAGRLDLSAT